MTVSAIEMVFPLLQLPMAFPLNHERGLGLTGVPGVVAGGPAYALELIAHNKTSAANLLQ